jgi:hypothetical protein
MSKLLRKELMQQQQSMQKAVSVSPLKSTKTHKNSVAAENTSEKQIGGLSRANTSV